MARHRRTKRSQRPAVVITSDSGLTSVTIGTNRKAGPITFHGPIVPVLDEDGLTLMERVFGQEA